MLPCLDKAGLCCYIKREQIAAEYGFILALEFSDEILRELIDVVANVTVSALFTIFQAYGHYRSAHGAAYLLDMPDAASKRRSNPGAHLFIQAKHGPVGG